MNELFLNEVEASGLRPFVPRELELDTLLAAGGCVLFSLTQFP